MLALTACGGGLTDAPRAAGCSLSAEEIADEELAVLSSHLIEGDTLLCAPTEQVRETFAVYTGLVPAAYRQDLVAFVAIDQEQSDGAVGALQDVLGPDGAPTGERYLALDVTGAGGELERTVVHELGHALFLSPASEVPTSYTAEFSAAFPPGGSYARDPDHFVSEYAASSPDGQEDQAESWAMYVLGGTRFAGDSDDDGELDVVPPGTVAAEKVAFWSGYPELVTLREDILAGAGL